MMQREALAAGGGGGRTLPSSASGRWIVENPFMMTRSGVAGRVREGDGAKGGSYLLGVTGQRARCRWCGWQPPSLDLEGEKMTNM